MKPDSPTLSVGLIGFGIAGNTFHAPLIQATPRLDLRAIVTGDPARQAQARRRYPNAQIYDDPDAFFDHSTDLDLVVVATPNDSHVEHALNAIERGLAVVVDKPLAPTAAAAARVVAAAKGRGSFLTVFQNRRWDGDFLTIRRLVETDALGSIFRFNSRFESWAPAIKPGWREDPAAAIGGGVLVDLGVHLVDQAVTLFGEVDSVYAEIATRRAGARVDDDDFLSLRFRNGTLAHINVSRTDANPEARFHVAGSLGSYTKFGLDVQEGQLRAGLDPDSAGWGANMPPDLGVVVRANSSMSDEVDAGRYQDFYAAVSESLIEGTPPPVDPNDAIYTMRIIEAARASALRGAEVVVSRDFAAAAVDFSD